VATDVVEEPADLPEIDAAALDGLDGETSEAASGGKFALGGKKAKVLALLVIVMIVQGAAMYLLFPKPAETNKDEAASSDPEEGSGSSNIATAEVLIDSFNTTNSRAEPGSVLNVTFELVAEVSSDNELVFTQAANKARVKQAIVEVIRSASLPDLNDPNLITIKRLMKEKINKVLRNSYVIQVFVSEFRVFIQ
jgi:flagellar basal body-associated protein FliL